MTDKSNTQPTNTVNIKKKTSRTKKFYKQCENILKSNGIELRPYQKEGVLWMIKRELRKRRIIKGGLLCDEMGLGKTLQTIALILSRPLKGHKTLIVTPCSVLKFPLSVVLLDKISHLVSFLVSPLQKVSQEFHKIDPKPSCGSTPN